MPEAPSNEEQMCFDNILIPPQLPNILKIYTKAAIRTQPNDLLRWTYSYMRDMRDGKKPPVKERGENEPVERSNAGLTPGFLRVLHMMLKDEESVSSDTLRAAWEDLSFDPDTISDVIERAELSDGRSNDWRKVLVIFANTIPPDRDVAQTMRIVCEVLTDQPEGSEPYIEFRSMWLELYFYLAEVMGISPDNLVKVENYLSNQTSSNANLVGPKDFLDSECPSLS